MIHDVLQLLKEGIQQFLRRKEPSLGHEDKIILSNLMNPNGELAFKGENLIVCSLFNIEQEGALVNVTAPGLEKKHPPLSLNLYLLFSAYFPGDENIYKDGLKFLSYVIAYFEDHKVFNAANTPGFPGNLSRLSAEMVNMELQSVGNVWNAIGSKLLPSVIYKVRLVSLSEDMILEELPEITGTENTVS